MEPADIVNGGISLFVSLLCVLIATKVIPIAKTKKENEKFLKKNGWLLWLTAFGTALMGVIKMFGLMG